MTLQYSATRPRLRPRQRALALAIHFAAAGFVALPIWPATAMAQPTSQQYQQYDIPAGPVSTVLSRFAAQSGIYISGAGELGEGRHSPGLQGQYSVDEGLTRLLNGTSLRAERQSDGSYRLQERPTDMELSVVEVSAERYRGVATEGTDSYTSNRVTIGKHEQSLRDIPQSVSIITRERMDDQGMTSLIDAMEHTTGIHTTHFGGDTATFHSRGFQVGTVLLDGSPVQGIVGYTDSSSFDTALFDRIEVLRGPTGILQGAGEPSGTINMVRKRAQREFGFNTSLTAGSWNAYRGVIDTTGALNSDGSVRGRFVAVYDERDSFVDHVERQKSVGYGTLEIDVTDNTTVSLGAIYQSGKSTPFLGLPAYADGNILDVSRSTFLGSTWDEKDEKMERYFIELEHAMESGASFVLKANSLQRDTDTVQNSASTSFVDPATGTVEIWPWRHRSVIDDRSLEAIFSTPFAFLGGESRVTLGASYQRGENKHPWSGGERFYKSVFNPDNNSEEMAFALTHREPTVEKQTGLYAQTSLELSEQTTLLMGGRLSWWKTTPGDSPEDEFKVRDEFTPYMGIIYDIAPDISTYASYTNIFQPQSNLSATGDVLEPRTGNQIELGLKGEHFDGRLNWHTAIFRIDDENRAINDPEVPGASISAGKARSQGFEAEISGTLLPRWDVSAGYAYTDTELVRDPGNEGLSFSPETPEHSFNLWSRYRFSEMPNEGWRIGAGIKAVSGAHARRDDVVWEQGGYTLLSAQVGYRLNENLDFSINGNNLTDKKYYSRVSGNTRNSYYGDPRNVMLTMRYSY